jgi:hypothetical protein
VSLLYCLHYLSSLLFLEPPTLPSSRSLFIAVVTSVLHLHPQDALSCVLLPSTVTVLVANPHAKHFAGVIARVTVIGSTGFPVGLLGFASKLDSDPSITIVVIALLYSTTARSMQSLQFRKNGRMREKLLLKATQRNWASVIISMTTLFWTLATNTT